MGLGMADGLQPRPLKPHLTREQQLDRLVERGLQVANCPAALQFLQHHGYCRLSGYFYPLRKTKPDGESGRLDDFVDGASFELVAQLVQFDKTLRLLAMDAIEAVEVSVRVAIAHRLGRLDPEAHLKRELLDGKFSRRPGRDDRLSAYDRWLARFEKACADSKEDFVKHHRRDYESRMPIWVAIELWDFGLLSRFFSGMQMRDQNAIAQEYGPLDGQVLASWLRSFNFIRNVTAHHSRLWNRTLTDVLKLPPLDRCRWLQPLHQEPRATEKVFGGLTCLQLLLRRISPGSCWAERVKAHVDTFPKTDLVSLQAAGFRRGWQDSPVWRT